MTNEEFARSLVTLEEYEQMIENYKRRKLEGRNLLWFNTLRHQHFLKQAS